LRANSLLANPTGFQPTRPPVGHPTLFSRYTDFVLKKITITLDPEVAHWARRKAADENTSVSKLVSRLLEKEMRASDSYWRAYEEWKRLPRDLGAPAPIDASKRMTRDEVHERR
jgi:hypothetical protein